MRFFRQKITLATKLGVKRDLRSHLSYGSIISSCEESLKRLKTEYVDLYVVHFNDPETPVEETIGGLRGPCKRREDPILWSGTLTCREGRGVL